jgi:type IV pilus assembly protein PilA
MDSKNFMGGKHMLKAMHKFGKNEKGFTLIELLIVIAIIAILAAIAIPQFGAYRARAVRASMVADGKNIATALETIFQDCTTYAPAAGAGATGPAQVNLNFTAATCTQSPYNANLSKNNILAMTAATATGWTMTVTNAGGNETGVWVGPITRDQTGSCTWATGNSAANGPC